MKRLLNLSSLALIGSLSVIVFASGCPVAIKNIEFCRDKGKFGAKCAYWLDAKDTLRTVPLSEWNAKRLGMVCTSEAGMGNVNGIIEKLCQSKQCVQQTQELVKALE
jgi:hypothetical protein